MARTLRRHAVRLAAALIMLLGAAAARPAETGLKMPRFVSLRSNEVNLRTGPGTAYPVEWVYVRRHMPVEVVAEFDTWRKIRDWQGTIGWVHQSMLDGRRTVLVTGGERILRRAPQPAAAAVARIQAGAVGDLLACNPEWCRIEIKGYAGWLRRAEIWGVYPNEAIE